MSDFNHDTKPHYLSAPFHRYTIDIASLPTYPATLDFNDGESESAKLIACAAECNTLRVDGGNVCNSFTVDGNTCSVGYTEPSVIVDSAAGSASSVNAKKAIFVDFPDPL